MHSLYLTSCFLVYHIILIYSTWSIYDKLTQEIQKSLNHPLLHLPVIVQKCIYIFSIYRRTNTKNIFSEIQNEIIQNKGNACGHIPLLFKNIQPDISASKFLSIFYINGGRQWNSPNSILAGGIFVPEEKACM